MDKIVNAEALRSAEDAVEIGFEIGRTLRESGASKSKEKLHMSDWSAAHLASPHLESWRRGFLSGYRGGPNPNGAGVPAVVAAPSAR